MSGYNLPPGCRESDLPGCSKADEISEQLLESWDNYEGWAEWIGCNSRRLNEFEEWVFDNFWAQLKEQFVALLHPDDALLRDADDPIGDHLEKWSLFIWKALDPERREVLVRSYVDSNRDEFEQWAVS